MNKQGAHYLNLKYNTESFTDFMCPECGTPVDGEGSFATGLPRNQEDSASDDYKPKPGEWLQNIWMVCPECNWNQYS